MEKSNKRRKIVKISIILAIILILVGILLALIINSNTKEEIFNVTFVVDGVEYHDNVWVVNGSISPLPSNPTKEGYVFDYWEIDGKKYTGNEKITSDVTLVAVFREKEKVIVTFNKDNGEKGSTKTIYKYEKVTAISPPKKTGYEFIGWYLDVDDEYGEDELFSFDTKVEENITLIAKWEPLVYIITFDSNGGSNVGSKVVDYKNKVKVPNEPTREGYNFLGWYLNDKKYDFNTKVTKDITLVAKWEKIAYGDLDEDGEVKSLDALRVLKYINGELQFTEQEKKNADVNVNNKINYEDVVLILGNSVGHYENTLPNIPIKNYTLYGDLDEDGLLTKDDYNKLNSFITSNTTISEQAKKNADVNGNGKIDEMDLKNLNSRLNNQEYVLDGVIRASTTPIIDYIAYGDLDEDGIINEKDSIKLQQYLNKEITLNTQSTKNADVNGDGKVDEVDLDLLSKYLLNNSDGKVPTNPLS